MAKKMSRSEAKRDIEELDSLYESLAAGKSRHGTHRLEKLTQKSRGRVRNSSQHWELMGSIRPRSVLDSSTEEASSRRIQFELPRLPSLPRPHIDFSKFRLPRPTRRHLRQFVANPWGKLVVLLFSAVIFYYGFRIGVILFDRPAPEPVQTDVAPATVYIPHNLPEGFSIGSGSQRLENGAELYTIYDSKGHTITITQQLLPASFDHSIFGGAAGFNTPLGKGYIVESENRITGYVMADKTMLLFNAAPDIEPQTLFDLMVAFQP